MEQAQVSAPIELLVSVIILAMVLVIGTYTYSNMCINQYNQKIKASLTKFSNDMATVYGGSTGTQIISELDFTTMGCGKGEITGIHFMEGTDNYCLTNLGTPSCYTLVAVGKGIQSGVERAVVITTMPLRVPYEASIYHTRAGEFDDVNTGAGSYLNIFVLTDVNANRFSTGWTADTAFSWGPYIYALKIKKDGSNEILLVDGR